MSESRIPSRRTAPPRFERFGPREEAGTGLLLDRLTIDRTWVIIRQSYALLQETEPTGPLMRPVPRADV